MDEKIDEIDNKINEIIDKYIEVARDKNTKFDKINISLPRFIYELVTEEAKDIGQVKMNNGIFISQIVDDYYEYIQSLYNINSSLYDEEILKYERLQLSITMIPETMNTIESIKTLIGTSDRVGVVKNAIEYYFKTKTSCNNKECNCSK